jgi:hypothetical protein
MWRILANNANELTLVPIDYYICNDFTNYYEGTTMATNVSVSSVLEDLLLINDVANTVEVTQQLPAKLYGQVKQVLTRLGGKWNSSDQLFHFAGRPARDLVERAIGTGTRRLNTFHYFPTPDSIFNAIAQFTSLSFMGASRDTIKVLEPSCGEGSLISALLDFGQQEKRVFDIDAYDIDPLNVLMADQLKADVKCQDFLTVVPQPVYDLVLMNPPFSGLTYIKHIQHAQRFLKPNGVLISVCPTEFTEQWDSKSGARWLLERAQMSSGSLLDSGDWFPVKTFKGVNITTTLIEITSESSFQASCAHRKNTMLMDWDQAINSEDDFAGRFSNSDGVLNADKYLASKVRQETRAGLVALCRLHSNNLPINVFEEVLGALLPDQPSKVDPGPKLQWIDRDQPKAVIGLAVPATGGREASEMISRITPDRRMKHEQFDMFDCFA